MDEKKRKEKKKVVKEGKAHLDFDVGVSLSVVDTDDGANHLGEDEGVTSVGADDLGLVGLSLFADLWRGASGGSGLTVLGRGRAREEEGTIRTDFLIFFMRLRWGCLRPRASRLRARQLRILASSSSWRAWRASRSSPRYENLRKVRFLGAAAAEEDDDIVKGEAKERNGCRARKDKNSDKCTRDAHQTETKKKKEKRKKEKKTTQHKEAVRTKAKVTPEPEPEPKVGAKARATPRR